tara:strand:+ start:1046 stop:1276 length:231 start_codon:yes stop_codon:yes gene_type:complete
MTEQLPDFKTIDTIDIFLLTNEEQQSALEQFRKDTDGQDVTLWQLIEFQFREQVKKVFTLQRQLRDRGEDVFEYMD